VCGVRRHPVERSVPLALATHALLNPRSSPSGGESAGGLRRSLQSTDRGTPAKRPQPRARDPCREREKACVSVSIVKKEEIASPIARKRSPLSMIEMLEGLRQDIAQSARWTDRERPPHKTGLSACCRLARLCRDTSHPLDAILNTGQSIRPGFLRSTAAVGAIARLC